MKKGNRYSVIMAVFLILPLLIGTNGSLVSGQVPPLEAPVLTADPAYISQGQSTNLSCSQITTGTPPYTFQWFQRAPGGEFTAVGDNSLNYTFQTTSGSTPNGWWSFSLQVTDSLGDTVNSSTIDVSVYSTSFFTVTVVQGTHGTINPGTMRVSPGLPLSLNITAEAGYHVADVLVDGASVGAVTAFTFEAVGYDHTVTAVFTQTDCYLIYNVIGSGSVTKNPVQSIYHYGDVVEFTAIPMNGWIFSGWSGGFSTSANPVSVMVNETIFVTATFIQGGNLLTVNALGEGSVALNNTGPYQLGDIVQLTANPASGWRFSAWSGSLSGSVNPCTIIINGAMSVTATFLPEQVSINATTGSGGAISPSGTVYIDWHANQTFAIIPDSGNFVSDLIVDGYSVGPATSYTFSNVTANHTITASFMSSSNSFFIDVLSSHGTPTQSAQVSSGGNYTVSVTSPEGDSSHRWICTGYSVDGGAFLLGTAHTFANVQESHTIIFAWQEQYSLTIVSQVGSPSGAGWYNAGAEATPSVSSGEVTNGGTKHIFIGWGGDAAGSNPIGDTIVMDSPKTATASWKTRYYLTVLSSQGNPSGEGWYDAGAMASFSVDMPNLNTSDTQFVFNWKSANGGYTGDSPSATVTMNSPVTQEAAWTTQYKVTYAVKGNLLAVYPPQAEWVSAGTAVTPEFPESVINTGGDTRSILVSDDRPSTVNSPITVTGTYKTQYLVRFVQDGLDSNVSNGIVEIQGIPLVSNDPSKGLWVDAGRSITFSYITSVEDASTGTQFALRSTNSSSSLTVNSPITIKAEYGAQADFDISGIAVPTLLIFSCALSPVPLVLWHKRKRKVIPVAGEGGSISPSAIQKIERGHDSTVFIITAKPGYEIEDVMIDYETHLGPVRTYKFASVKENHVLSAKFSKR